MIGPALLGLPSRTRVHRSLDPTEGHDVGRGQGIWFGSIATRSTDIEWALPRPDTRSFRCARLLCAKRRHTTGHRTIASVRMLPSNGGMKKSQRHGPLEPP